MPARGGAAARDRRAERTWPRAHLGRSVELPLEEVGTWSRAKRLRALWKQASEQRTARRQSRPQRAARRAEAREHYLRLKRRSGGGGGGGDVGAV